MAAMEWVGKLAVGMALGATLAGGTLAIGGSNALAEKAGVEAASPSPLKQSRAARSQAYTTAMLSAYAAAERRDYHTALINFRRALSARPGDRYATAGIRNMETYIAQQRAEAAKQAEIIQRQETLAQAVAANDWACAAASVDRLVVLIPPDSVDRARLIAYRGELTGFIQSRANLEQWSTVCPGGQV
jgi:hypothetical protein